VAAVLIEGVPFEPVELAEFARRVRQYGASPDVMHPKDTLAVNLEHRAAQSGGAPLELTENERVVAAAVLDAWLQAGAGSKAVRDLRHMIASR
jgi:hypothetical protein